VRALRDFLLAPPARAGTHDDDVDDYGGVPDPPPEDGITAPALHSAPAAPPIDSGHVLASPLGDGGVGAGRLAGGGVSAPPLGDGAVGARPLAGGGGVGAPPLGDSSLAAPPVSRAGPLWRRRAWAARARPRPARVAHPDWAAAPLAVALLCAPDDAATLGVAAAALMARRVRAPCALVCVWTGPHPRRRPDPRAPASRAARRLTVALVARGLDATARARAAVVALPAEPADAVAATARAGAAAGSHPTVLVLAGPRPSSFDELLAHQDRVLVLTRPGADPKVASLAVAGIPSTGATATAHAVGLGPAARALAAAGLAVPAALRRALDPAQEP
jgi:hypothetical protein